MGQRSRTELAQSTPYHKITMFCLEYLLSVSIKTLPIKFFIDGKNFTSMKLVDY